MGYVDSMLEGTLKACWYSVDHGLEIARESVSMYVPPTIF